MLCCLIINQQAPVLATGLTRLIVYYNPVLGGGCWL